MSSNQDDENIVQEQRITKITKHPNYVEGVAYFDIAVLEIEPIEYTAHVRTICLPSSKDFTVNKYEGVRQNHIDLLNIFMLGVHPKHAAVAETCLEVSIVND